MILVQVVVFEKERKQLVTELKTNKAGLNAS